MSDHEYYDFLNGAGGCVETKERYTTAGDIPWQVLERAKWQTAEVYPCNHFPKKEFDVKE